MAFGETLREPFLDSSIAARGGEAASSARLRVKKPRQSKTVGQSENGYGDVGDVGDVESSQAD